LLPVITEQRSEYEDDHATGEKDNPVGAKKEFRDQLAFDFNDRNAQFLPTTAGSFNALLMIRASSSSSYE